MFLCHIITRTSTERGVGTKVIYPRQKGTFLVKLLDRAEIFLEVKSAHEVKTQGIFRTRIDLFKRTEYIMSVLIATNPVMNSLTPVNGMPPMTSVTPLGPVPPMQHMTPIPPMPPANPLTTLTPVPPMTMGSNMGTVVPDLFHLINYGDQNLGLLLSQR